MKLKNIHLFLILLIVLILSHFGLVIREGVDGLYLSCSPEDSTTSAALPKSPPPLENPVVQAIVAVGIAIITAVIIHKLM